MTGETVECFNCGRPNPEWAQVCRSCGVPLRQGEPGAASSSRFPTDTASLLSIGAVIATIAVAVVIGFVFASVNPTEPTVGLDGSPSPIAVTSPSEEPSVEPTPIPETPAPTPVPLLGTVAFGTGYDDATGEIIEPTTTFTPGIGFAHTVTLPEEFGVDAIGEQVVRVLEDGTEEEVVPAADNQLPVDPAATVAGVVCCDAAELIGDLGPGNYILRVYRGDELIAEGPFTLAEG